MTDIAERLRDLALDYPDKPWISEAADEIERLKGELHSVHAHLNHLRREIDRLRGGEVDPKVSAETPEGQRP